MFVREKKLRKETRTELYGVCKETRCEGGCDMCVFVLRVKIVCGVYDYREKERRDRDVKVV